MHRTASYAEKIFRTAMVKEIKDRALKLIEAFNKGTHIQSETLEYYSVVEATEL